MLKTAPGQASMVRGDNWQTILAPQPGPASKDGPDSGIIIPVKSSALFKKSWGVDYFAVIVAHELGHYLGLKHVGKGGENVMFPMKTDGYNTKLTWDQHKIIATHPYVKRLNP